jgi:hypothetical protein
MTMTRYSKGTRGGVSIHCLSQFCEHVGWNKWKLTLSGFFSALSKAKLRSVSRSVRLSTSQACIPREFSRASLSPAALHVHPDISRQSHYSVSQWLLGHIFGQSFLLLYVRCSSQRLMNMEPLSTQLGVYTMDWKAESVLNVTLASFSLLAATSLASNVTIPECPAGRRARHQQIRHAGLTTQMAAPHSTFGPITNSIPQLALTGITL